MTHHTKTSKHPICLAIPYRQHLRHRPPADTDKFEEDDGISVAVELPRVRITLNIQQAATYTLTFAGNMPN